VTSEPIDVTDGAEKGLYVDLFAFLYPSMILVPPLRNRIEDIAPLMTFVAIKNKSADPIPRMTSEVLQALQRYHWPRNVEELETATRFVLERRPAGEIGLSDLPESVQRAHAVPQSVLDALREIHHAEGFRVLSTEAGRRGVARFLTEPHGTSFGALDFMKAFNQGRETTRRIMASFISKGIVVPVKGPTQQRTTSYRRAALCEPPVDE
jgi:DNA-binding NtrC family response regulator